MQKNYRIYFRNENGWIEACEDLRADSPQSALALAACLFSACSDCCVEYDVWCGRERIGDASQPTFTPMPLTIKMHKSLQKTAEALLNSRWKIAKSERLLELVGQLKRARRQVEVRPWMPSRVANDVVLRTQDAAWSE